MDWWLQAHRNLMYPVHLCVFFTRKVSHASLFSQRVEEVEELPSERVESGVTQENSTHAHLWHPKGGVQGAVRIGWHPWLLYIIFDGVLGKIPCHWRRTKASPMFKKVQKDGPDFPAGKYLISVVLIKNDENILKVNTLVIL